MKSCILILNYFLEPDQDTSTSRAYKIVADEFRTVYCRVSSKWFLLKLDGVYFEQFKYQLWRHLSARYYSHFLVQCGVILTGFR